MALRHCHRPKVLVGKGDGCNGAESIGLSSRTRLNLYRLKRKATNSNNSNNNNNNNNNNNSNQYNNSNTYSSNRIKSKNSINEKKQRNANDTYWTERNDWWTYLQQDSSTIWTKTFGVYFMRRMRGFWKTSALACSFRLELRRMNQAPL